MPFTRSSTSARETDRSRVLRSIDLADAAAGRTAFTSSFSAARAVGTSAKMSTQAIHIHMSDGLPHSAAKCIRWAQACMPVRHSAGRYCSVADQQCGGRTCNVGARTSDAGANTVTVIHLSCSSQLSMHSNVSRAATTDCSSSRAAHACVCRNMRKEDHMLAVSRPYG